MVKMIDMCKYNTVKLRVTENGIFKKITDLPTKLLISQYF